MDADQIKALRSDLGLTREEFAVRLGSSLRSVQRWEAGRGKPDKRSLRAIEAAASRLSRTKRPASK